MYFCVTNDVEEHSIALNRLDEATAWQVYREGLPGLLDLYSKYDVVSTFYFTGTFAETIPEAVELVMEHGHEIGCHGYCHEVERSFDLLTVEEQIADLTRAKKVIEDIAGKIVSFRAPSLRINEGTVEALERTEFLTDSSIASQRFDGPFTFGARKKLKWLFSPRTPFYLDHSSLMERGSSNVLEIPVSAFLLAFTGTMMRISPTLNRTLERFLFHEAGKGEKPIVFLFHPVEALEVEGTTETTRRSKSTFNYIFGDVIRQRMKLKNLGKRALLLHEEILKTGKQNDFEFISAKEYRRIFMERRNGNQ